MKAAKIKISGYKVALLRLARSTNYRQIHPFGLSL
jgi:hypothetical protein